MSKGAYGILAALAALSAFALAQPASALTMRECSEKYKAADAAGKTTWNDFRAAECGPGATMAVKPTKAKVDKTAKTEKAPTPDKMAKTDKETKAVKETPASTETKVSSTECSERYQAAKSAGTLGGMTWNKFRKAGCPTTIAKTTGNMVPTAAGMFPTAISKKYAAQPAGKARRMTCLDQYRANKAAGINQLRWTKAGGGYYSECNKRLSQQ
jgi:hypothetical protein